MDSTTRLSDSTLRRLMGRLALATALAAAIVLAASSGALTARAVAQAGQIFKGVPYGTGSLQWMDILPSPAPGSPLVVLVHGGGWHKQPGTLYKWELEAQSLQNRGFSVFMIAYDQDSAQRPAFPLEPADVVLATRWAIAHAASYNANPAKAVLLGGSAGGQLVAVAAEQLAGESPGTIKGVISLSGPMNFVTLTPQLEANTLKNESFNTDVHLALGWPEGTPFPQAYAEQWSPALHVPSANCPNWMIVNSEAEFIPLGQAKEMYANLRAARCNASLTVLSGEEHAFAYWRRVKAQVEAFIEAQ